MTFSFPCFDLDACAFSFGICRASHRIARLCVQVEIHIYMAFFFYCAEISTFNV